MDYPWHQDKTSTQEKGILQRVLYVNGYLLWFYWSLWSVSNENKTLKRGRLTFRIEPEPLECWCQDYLLEINKCIIAQPNYKSIRFRVKELVLKCQLNKSYQISKITSLPVKFLWLSFSKLINSIQTRCQSLHCNNVITYKKEIRAPKLNTRFSYVLFKCRFLSPSCTVNFNIYNNMHIKFKCQEHIIVKCIKC